MENFNVLLIGINAKYIHSNPAVYSLKAYADKYYRKRPAEYRVDIAEYTVNQPYTEIIADIYARKPRVAAFSCYIWNWSMIRTILPELQKLLRGTDIWLGGPEVSYDADKLVGGTVTGVMIGEGEETFTELLHYYWEGEPDLADIRGLFIRNGFTGERATTDINILPFIYDNLVTFQNRIIYYESQRGCPFKCAYCLSSIDKSVRFRDIETVKRELQLFLDNNVKQVKFIDRTFNCNSEHALSIWKYLEGNDNGITNFHFEIAADLLTDAQLDVINRMRKGLIQLEIGMQSTNPCTLRAINRHTDIKTLKNNVLLIHGFGNVHQHLDLIAGLPYENYDTFVNSFNEVYDMNSDQLQLGFLKVLKGSPIEQKAADYGIVYSSAPPYEVLYTKWLSFDDILQLKGVEEMVELYYNSGQFGHTLSVLVKEFSSPFEMYSNFARYYRQNGFMTNSPSRMYRYQVLLDFSVSFAPDREQLYTELLIFDMYLRENLKSRPAFAKDANTDKAALRRFYEREAAEHIYLNGYEGFSSAQLARMTHIESFTYPVWENSPIKCSSKLSTTLYILFDYAHRDILTNNAKWQVVEI